MNKLPVDNITNNSNILQSMYNVISLNEYEVFNNKVANNIVNDIENKMLAQENIVVNLDNNSVDNKDNIKNKINENMNIMFPSNPDFYNSIFKKLMKKKLETNLFLYGTFNEKILRLANKYIQMYQITTTEPAPSYTPLFNDFGFACCYYNLDNNIYIGTSGVSGCLIMIFFSYIIFKQELKTIKNIKYIYEEVFNCIMFSKINKFIELIKIKKEHINYKNIVAIFSFLFDYAVIKTHDERTDYITTRRTQLDQQEKTESQEKTNKKPKKKSPTIVNYNTIAGVSNDLLESIILKATSKPYLDINTVMFEMRELLLLYAKFSNNGKKDGKNDGENDGEKNVENDRKNNVARLHDCNYYINLYFDAMYKYNDYAEYKNKTFEKLVKTKLTDGDYINFKLNDNTNIYIINNKQYYNNFWDKQVQNANPDNKHVIKNQFVPFKNYKLTDHPPLTPLEMSCYNGSTCAEPKLFNWLYNKKIITKDKKQHYCACFWNKSKPSVEYGVTIDSIPTTQLSHRKIYRIGYYDYLKDLDINIYDNEGNVLSAVDHIMNPCPGCKINYKNIMNNKTTIWRADNCDKYAVEFDTSNSYNIDSFNIENEVDNYELTHNTKMSPITLQYRPSNPHNFIPLQQVSPIQLAEPFEYYDRINNKTKHNKVSSSTTANVPLKNTTLKHNQIVKNKTKLTKHNKRHRRTGTRKQHKNNTV